MLLAIMVLKTLKGGMIMYEELATALSELDEDAVLDEVRGLSGKGVPAVEILAALQKGMELVGSRFEAKEYYLSELIMSADIFKSATEILGDAFTADDSGKLGTMVIGTVKDDVHDIGKNIVATVMGSNGFKVIDLGVDVAPEKFIAAIKEYHPQIVGLSCLLTVAFDSMRDTIAAIEAAGLRKDVKILIGGGPTDEKVREYVKADGVCLSAQAAVEACKKIVGVN
jgi:methylmalonyl-CoA mutase cobalamin-binding domain/chain